MLYPVDQNTRPNVLTNSPENAQTDGGSIHNYFAFTVDTTQAGSANDTFVLPLPGSGTYNYTIDWGEDNAVEHYTANTSQTHVYASSGTYTIKISGTFPRIYFNNAGDKAKLITVVSMGTIEWGSLSAAFYGCSNLTSFIGGPNVDTSVTTSMHRAFYNCTSLTTLDVSGFDTSSVTSMGSAFQECTSLTTLDVSGFDTSSVTSMNAMFRNCSSLTTLDVSGFDTSLVENMAYMFRGCASLTTLDVSGFDTSLVTSMIAMFYQCSSVTALDVSGFDTSVVTNMSYMFHSCSSVVDLDPSGFNIGSLTAATDMMNGSSFATTEYDLLLVAWEGQTHNNGVTFHAGTAKYNAGAPATARAALVTDGWTITDGGAV